MDKVVWIISDWGAFGSRAEGQGKGITADGASTRILKQLTKGHEEIYVASGAKRITPIMKRFVLAHLQNY